MKILFCLGSMDKGGAQRVIANLANFLVKDNEINIVTTSNRKSQYELNEKVCRFFLDENNTRGNNFFRLKRLSKIIKKEKPDLIVTFQPEPSFRILLLKILNRIPVVLSVRNDPSIEYKSIKRKIMMKILYPLADGYVFQTQDAKNYFSKIIKRKKVAIIPNPINEQFIADKLYVGKREKTIVTVGRIEKQKNQKLLIDAFEKISKDYDEYKLLIYGEGRLRKDLEKYVKKIELSKKVIFKGQVDNIKEEIFKAGIFVLSSDYEGMPNALMEAMALGIPSVSTDCPCGGPKNIIKNNENGILVKVNDVNELKEAIKKLIEDDKFAKKISYNAIKIRETFNPIKIANMWKDFIIETKNL